MTEVAKTYSDRHLDPREAYAYRNKFRRGILRRLSHARERAIIKRAFCEALELLPEDIVENTGRPRLLDFPCGAGRFATLFARGANELGGVYLAADHSPSMLEICEGTLRDDKIVAEAFCEGDAREMPFANDAFDIACCIRLIHHFWERSERAQILREFRRVNTGPLVVTFLDAESAKQVRHQKRCERAQKQNRRAIMSREGLREEAADCHYEVVSVRSLSGRFSGQCVAVLRPSA